MKIDKRFKIGNFCFRLICPQSLVLPKNIYLFEIEPDSVYEYIYEMRIVHKLPIPSGKEIARRRDLVVYETKVGEERLIGVKGAEGYYAYYCEISESKAEVCLAEQWISSFAFDPVFHSLLALERRMISKNQLILHCAYIEYQGKAILFSAPSETGKTTQANLWGKYRGSRTINGDRALLGKIGGVWNAQGWPVCGTSNICQNEKFPVKGIVILSQAKENSVNRIGGREAFMLLYSQITVNSWNRESSNQAIDLLMELLENIPIYHLQCDISENAVKCLENIIYKSNK